MNQSLHLLIFKLGALGDAAMLLPAVVARKQQNPELNVTWVCGAAIAPFLQHCPAIDKLVIVDEKKIFGRVFERLVEVIKMRVRLNRLRPTHVFIGNPDWKYRASLFGLFRGARRSIFFPVAKKSHIEQYASSLSHLFKSVVLLDFQNFKEATTVRGENNPKKKLILAPGGARNALADDPARRAPVEIFTALAKNFLDQDYEVVLIGGAQDEELIKNFSSLPVRNLVGKTSIPQLLEEITQAQILISNDSGPLYLALSKGTAAIGLFGPTDKDERIPVGSRALGIVGTKAPTLACFPCYNGKQYGLCNRPLCIETFDSEKIVEISRELQLDAFKHKWNNKDQ